MFNGSIVEEDTEMHSLATAALAQFDEIHDDLRRVVGDLQAEALNWRPGEETNSIYVLVTHLLGAEGAMAAIIPRASEERTYQRWKLVFRANALTSCLYVLSVNRPAPEEGVLIGGPSIAVDPGGNVMLETTDTIGLVTVDAAVVRKARADYPGYLPVRAALYADAWREIAGRDG